MIDHPAFPIDVWKVRETAFSPDVLPQSETLFALSNGYLGLRGNLDEGDPSFERGTYLNGFFERRPITYGESAYGYAQHDQTMLNVTDAKLLSLQVDGEPLDITTGSLIEHERVLDMRTATLTRHLVWEAPSGKRVAVRSRRFVSLADAHLAYIDYEVEALDRKAELVVSSSMVANESSQVKNDDPRATAALYGQVMLPRLVEGAGNRLMMVHTTKISGLSVACGMDHVVTSDAEYRSQFGQEDRGGRVDFSVTAEPGQPFRLTKYLAYHWSGGDAPDQLLDDARTSLDGAVTTPVATHVRGHRELINEFWNALAGLIIISVGLPAYFYWKRKAARESSR